MKLHIRNILFISLLLAIGLCGCASRKKNTAQTRMYHAFFAKYNTYYNGNVSYKKAKKEQINQHKDNYLEQLPLLIVSNTSTRSIGSSDYDRAIEKSQKAIKNHSIKKKPIRKAGEKLSAKKKKFFAQKEFNPFLWKAWMMMANSYFEKGEFTEAASTYIYITRLYENDPKVMAMARIGLAKCYTEMDWLYEAEDLIARIRRDSVPDPQEPELARAQANLLIKQERYSEALPLLEKAIKRKDATSREKAREFYLMGQLYRELGDNTAAFKSFGKTISKNPPYELEFNARIRQTETVTNEDKKKIIRSLQRMLKSPKNEDYISQLHYAIGNLHMSSKDTLEAIKSYETGVAEGASSGYGTAMLHLSLAKIYWEQERFSKSDANYKKAINMIDKESDDYKLHKHRSDILPDLVTHTDIIEENSELLYWASLSEEELIPLIDKKIEFAKWEEELRKKTEKKEEKEAGGSAGNDLASASNAANMTIANSNEQQLWYFYNPQLVAQGIKSFSNTWGNRTLKDFWRLSKENISFAMQDSIQNDSTDIALSNDSLTVALSDSITLEEIQEDTLSTDPTTREYYLGRIPHDDETKAEMHKKLSDAIFNSALVFEEKLGDKELALSYWERLVNEYPEYDKMSDVYYHLYLSCSRWEESEKAELYRNMLLTTYPDSTVTIKIQDPDFFESVAVKEHKEDSIYAESYELFKKELYAQVIENNSYATKKYPKGKHRARFMFIDALSKLYNGQQDEALEAIESLATEFSEEEITAMAQEISTGVKEGRLLNSGISLSIWERKSDGTIKGDMDSVPEFSSERNEPYYFILAYPNDSLDEKRLLFEIARYNFSRYMVRNFKMEFNKQAAITLLEIKEFLNFDEAFIYRKRLYSNGDMAKLLEGINAFIISKSNLDLLLNYYSFDDYRKFYEENLQNIPEPEIDGYTLDEPDYEITKEQ